MEHVQENCLQPPKITWNKVNPGFDALFLGLIFGGLKFQNRGHSQVPGTYIRYHEFWLINFRLNSNEIS